MTNNITFVNLYIYTFFSFFLSYLIMIKFFYNQFGIEFFGYLKEEKKIK